MLIPYVVLGVAAAFLPIYLALIPVALAFLAAGIFRMLQKCPECGASLARARVNFIGTEMQIYVPLAPRRCPNGHRVD